MVGHPDEELLASARIRRGRSPLFLPLLVVSVVGIGLVGHATIVAWLGQETGTTVEDPAEDEIEPSPWQCRSPTARADRLPEPDPIPVWFPTLMARSQLAVSGKITDGLLYADYGVAVVEVQTIDGVGQQDLDRLILPLSSTPAGAPWQGADFVAFLTDVSEFGFGTVAPGGFFFACGFDEPVSGLARFDSEFDSQTRSLDTLRQAFLAFRNAGIRHVTKVIAPRVHVLDIDTPDGARLAVYLPEVLAAPFDVNWVENPGAGRWHVVFANTEVVGRIGLGPCGDRNPEWCSGNVRIEVESLSGVEVPAALQFLGGPTVDAMQSAFGAPVVEERFGSHLANDLVVYLNGDAIFAVDELTLEPRWQRGGGPFSFARLGPGPARIVLRSELDGSLVGLKLDGTTEWRHGGGGTLATGVFTSAPILVQRWEYPDNDTRMRVLVALDPTDGSPLWDFAKVVPMMGAARVQERTGDGLFVLEITTESPLATRKEFIGLEQATGEVRWRVKPQPGGDVFELDGYLWWAGVGGIARIDGDSGEVLWRVDRGGIDVLTVEGGIVDLGDAGSFDLETGRRLRDAAVSPCC